MSLSSGVIIGSPSGRAQAADKPYRKNYSSSKCIILLAAFSLREVGAKKKLSKRNAIREISTSAEVEEGYAPSTAQAFEKA
jgi:hypothetical protein